MVRLYRSDIKTEEVLAWEGLHLLHAKRSTCSQKVRIALRLKKLDWHSHEVDIKNNENYGDWFLGINPRGLIPVLVHDGDVHIESNDIMKFVDDLGGAGTLFPQENEPEIWRLLTKEDALHLDLRSITMRFLFSPKEVVKNSDALAHYESANGTVLGRKDEQKTVQVSYWRKLNRHGVSDKTATVAARAFQAAFNDLEQRLTASPFLAGNTLTAVDLAWFVNTNRLCEAGYPLAELHPNVSLWFQRLGDMPEFGEEIHAGEAPSHQPRVRRESGNFPDISLARLLGEDS